VLGVVGGVDPLVPVLKEIFKDQLPENVMVRLGSGVKMFAQPVIPLAIVRVVCIGNPIVNGAVQEEVLVENGVLYLDVVN